MLREMLRPAFPPYELGSADYVREAQEKYARLEKLYHLAQSRSWNGKQVLPELIQKHGGIKIDPEKREPLARVLSVIMWGELAAWIISADLAERIDDVEARMAATAQVFDEARHFTTLRDYLLEMGGEIPPLDVYSAMAFRTLIGTSSLLHKLLGMQLLVETAAIDLFRTIAERNVDPVLSDLLPYFERDESRHVGLGVLYLPELLRRLSMIGVLRLQAFQARLISTISLTQALLAPDFEILGIDNNVIARRGLKLQQEALSQMAETRGILSLTAQTEWIFDRAIDFLFPPRGENRSTLAEGLMQAGNLVARGGNYALSFVF